MILIDIGLDRDIRTDTEGDVVNPSNLDDYAEYLVRVGPDILHLTGKRIKNKYDLRDGKYFIKLFLKEKPAEGY